MQVSYGNEKVTAKLPSSHTLVITERGSVTIFQAATATKPRDWNQEAVMRRTALQICLMMAFAISMAVAGTAQEPAQEIANPKQAALRYNAQAVNQINSGKYEAAIELLNLAIRLRPDYATAYYNLGTAYYFLDQSENAITALQKAIKLCPSYTEAYNQLGVVYADVAQYGKAIAAFEESISQNPDDSIAYYNLGCTYIRLKTFKAAIIALERAVQLQPSNVEARINLGFAYSRLKYYAAAITEMRQAVRLKPQDLEAQFFLGNLYLMIKDRQSALAQYQALKSLNPQFAQKLYDAIYQDRIVTVATQ
jgi:tetratricopeptide (TPR) repeat protein